MFTLKALVNTVIKARPIQSSELNDSDKFNLAQGQEIEIQKFLRAESDHFEITLVEPRNGREIWFAFRPHVSIDGDPDLSIRGADSFIRVTSNSTVNGAAQLIGGTTPEYWGRYFSGASFTGGGEYFTSENNTLRRNDVRVLPVGRFTTQVGLGKAEGTRDGRDQAGDLLVKFGEDYLESQGGEFYLFLDVEPSHPLSTEYYLAWAEAVQNISTKVNILPCVYLNALDSKTSNALNAAIEQGAGCHGLWIAAYQNRFRKTTISQDIDFDASVAHPATTVSPPVLFWQYAGEIGPNLSYDFNISNPLENNEQILKRLILPQAI